MKNKLQDTISIGCTVTLYCSTIKERADYKIVKNRDTVEYRPLFGGRNGIQNSVAIHKIANYSDDEIVEDCPLARALIGKKLHDSFKVNEYIYHIEKIIFLDGRILQTEANPITDVTKSMSKSFPRNQIDWNCGFASECSDEELNIIHSFDEFIKREFPRFVGESKMNRITFYDPTIKLNGLQYSQFWFVKRGGVLMFRYKLRQNEEDKIKYNDNVLIADNVQLNSIKILVRLILSTQTN